MRPCASVILCLILVPALPWPRPIAARRWRQRVGHEHGLAHVVVVFRVVRYRVNRVAGFEVDATAVPSLQSVFPGVSILGSNSSRAPDLGPDVESQPGRRLHSDDFPQPRLENGKARAVFFTNNVKVHIPTTADRIDP
jgi:hypothetical protein